MNWLKENWIAVVAGVMLLLAVPSAWPYAYYQLLRWVVTGAALFIAYKKYEEGSKNWSLTMVVIAILFNPIVPFFLDKEVWGAIDLVAAVIFFSSGGSKHEEDELD